MMRMMRGFRLHLVCAVGVGSAADACGVTNKGWMRVNKAEGWLLSNGIDDARCFTE